MNLGKANSDQTEAEARLGHWPALQADRRRFREEASRSTPADKLTTRRVVPDGETTLDCRFGKCNNRFVNADQGSESMTDGHSRSVPSCVPIKVVLPRHGRERSVSGRGSRDQPFQPVDSEFRRSLGRQIVALRKAIVPLADRTGSVPARLNLHALAVAKSHRPRTLFSAKTCPIIGAGELGELFIKTTLDGLDVLANRIETGHSRQIVKELSTILTVKPITPAFRCRGRTARDILTDCPRRDRGFLARVCLFEFPEQYESDKIYAEFCETCRKNEIDFSPNGYSDSSLTYGVICRFSSDIEALANTIGVRSIAAMPVLRTSYPRHARL